MTQSAASSLLHLPADLEGRLVVRRNRFLAEVEIGGQKALAHVHDPGRLKELLWPGNRLLLRRAGNPKRKTGYDLLAARGHGAWVLVHSGSHRALATRLLSCEERSPVGPALDIRPEVTYGRSRLDFEVRLRNGALMALEVKGCTLCRDGRALFPDAPTKRGARHLEELTAVRKGGIRAAVIVFIFCPGAACFAPNTPMDPLFSQRFHEARLAGVEIYPVSISYDGQYLYYGGILPLCHA